MGAITPLYAGASTEGVELNGKVSLRRSRVNEMRPDQDFSS